MAKRIIAVLLILLAVALNVSAQENEVIAFIKKGDDYAKSMDFRKANECYNKAIALLAPSEAIPEVKEMIETLRRGVRTYSLMNARDSIHTLAIESKKRGEYELANSYFEQEIAILDTLGFSSFIPRVRHIMAINDVDYGMKLIKTGAYTEARPYLLRALERDTIGSESYYLAHNWLGHLCEREETDLLTGKADLERAVMLCEEGEGHYSIVGKLNNMMGLRIDRAKKLTLLSRKAEAIKLYRQVVDECKGIDSLRLNRGKALGGLGELEISNGKYDDAIRHLEEAYSIFEKEGETGASPAYVSANIMTRLYTYNIGDTIAAKRWKERAVQKKAESDSYKAAKGTDISYITQTRLAKKYMDNMDLVAAAERKIIAGDIDNGIAELTALIEQFEHDPDVPLTMLANCYNYRASAKSAKKDYAAAVSDIEHSISVLNRAGAEGLEDKGTTWMSMGNYLWRCGRKTEALAAADSCVAATKAYYGLDHIETMHAYDQHGNLAASLGQKEIALNDMLNCYIITRNNVRRNFVYLTEHERWFYWHKYNKYIRQMAVFAHGLNDFESAFTDSLYSEQLLAKGLLLTTESALKQTVDNDPALRQTFERIRALRAIAANEKTSPSDAATANTEADRLERELGEKANGIHNFLDFMYTSPADVKKVLPRNTAAIEFIDYPGKGNSTMFAALVLTPNRDHVRLVPLLSDEELNKIAQVSNMYNSDSLSRLIWGKLADALADVKTVYFAPAGGLYSIGIEYLPDFQDSTRHIFDRWKLYRMSSTRELALNKGGNRNNRSAIFGGLRYNVGLPFLNREKKRHPLRDFSFTQISVADTQATRFSADSLPGTLREALYLDSILRHSGSMNKVSLYTDTIGTEGAFKALTGEDVSLIHIGTHGFYWTPQEASRHRNIKTLNLGDGNGSQQYAEDLALSRSGLIMAGATNALRGGRTPAGVDDGILTAKEIASLDLRGLDMVVLSACQTGLGDVSGEGVFGLQRGFKKAGAQSILMSLWKVDDRATELLMTRFYKNWLSGMTKQKALAEAQDFLRHHTEKITVKEKKHIIDGNYHSVDDDCPIEEYLKDQSYSDPNYWAAFILLDALD